MEGLNGFNHIFQRAIKRAEQTENKQVKPHKNKWALKRRKRETVINPLFLTKNWFQEKWFRCTINGQKKTWSNLTGFSSKPYSKCEWILAAYINKFNMSRLRLLWTKTHIMYRVDFLWFTPSFAIIKRYSGHSIAMVVRGLNKCADHHLICSWNSFKWSQDNVGYHWCEKCTTMDGVSVPKRPICVFVVNDFITHKPSLFAHALSMFFRPCAVKSRV